MDGHIGTDGIKKQSKQIGKYKIDFNYNSRMGQIVIWMPAEKHTLRIITKSEDETMDCVFMQTHKTPDLGKQAFEDIKDITTIEQLFTLTGFGKSCP